MHDDGDRGGGESVMRGLWWAIDIEWCHFRDVMSCYECDCCALLIRQYAIFRSSSSSSSSSFVVHVSLLLVHVCVSRCCLYSVPDTTYVETGEDEESTAEEREEDEEGGTRRSVDQTVGGQRRNRIDTTKRSHTHTSGTSYTHSHHITHHA